MGNIGSEYPRILAIAPAVRGVGFAVLDGQDTLAASGTKTGRSADTEKLIRDVEKLIDQYEPQLLVLENCFAKGSRRGPRVSDLFLQLAAAGRTAKLKTVLLSQQQVRAVFFGDSKGTKDAQAKIIAERFSEEIGHLLPSKRREWESEDHHMGRFEAVALAWAFRRKASAAMDCES